MPRPTTGPAYEAISVGRTHATRVCGMDGGRLSAESEGSR